MPILYPANLYSIDVETMCEDVPANVKFFYRLSTGAVAAFPALDLVNAWSAACLTTYRALVSSAVFIMRITGRCMRPADGVPYEANYTTAIVGTGAAEPLPPSVALLLQWRTTSTLSRNNGHSYIPGVPEANWVNGIWNATQQTANQNFIDAMLTPLAGAVPLTYYQFCVPSRYLNNTQRVTAVPFDVISGNWSDSISQQRRRQSGQQNIKA